MPVFRIENKKIKQLKVSILQDEKELQAIVENNLEEIFGIKLIISELPLGEKYGGRIDTLGLDENNSPVVIEYKWNERDDIINQGLFYLDWLVEHKSDFQILVEKKLKNIEIDWTQPRLILIASSFSQHDKSALATISENIELWTRALYESGIVEFKLEGISQADDIKGRRLTKIKYMRCGLNYHLNQTSEDLQKKFTEIREKILDWPNVQEKPEQRGGVIYKTIKSFVRFEFTRDYINACVRNKYDHIIDPKKIIKDTINCKWGYKGLIKITTETDVNYLLDLIKQSYQETL